MLLGNIPEDINVELLLAYFADGACKVKFSGLHKRNSYKDILDTKEERDRCLNITVGRKSLYNALPEFLFHPIERYGSLAKKEDRERFNAECQKQEQETEDAYRFFAPIDLLLLKLRMMIRERLWEFAETDKVLVDRQSDRLTEKQRRNRFIRQTVPFFPNFYQIRGDKTALTLVLRNVFLEEGLLMEKHDEIVRYSDDLPRYADGPGGVLGNVYVGNVYDEQTTLYDVHYWSDDDCDENFLQFVDEIEEFQSFVQDYLISMDETIRFIICKDEVPLRLSDDDIYNYLNYNTNL